MRAMGIGDGHQVVVYDTKGVWSAPRVWWTFRLMGKVDIAVLDGGLPAWLAAGGAVASGAAAPRPATEFRLQPPLRRLAHTGDVQTRLGQPGQTVVDARAAPRYRGDEEPLDPVAGHIPAALNRPFGDNMAPDGRCKPAAELRAEFERLLAGRDPATVVHHCGSGVSAVPNLLAMEVAGLGPTALFAGSWSEWCSDPTRPVEKG